ncbi:MULTISPECIES: ATP-binding cassette domain-containing protein [Paenibacillus]|uniref:ABC transporter domain-containing protein n=2 Tax=Paenibacillus TaxID=44249 RepID=A0A1R0X1I1_9BACL|nr:ABC transporter ATP-binding protein [Paenibacillus odorifer]OMD26724.1 hypothetical protein BJP51_26390 [Paenibacillus odorifer]OME30565.1 hypothetical protein BSK63_16860 [Paenibacillus odorifer]OME32622.1 hypothetical protein BSK58_27945 [Paenibacillus odorifer]
MRTIRQWLLYLIKGNVKPFIVNILILLISPCIAYGSFKITKEIFDSLTIESGFNLILILCLAMLIIKFSQTFISELSYYIQQKLNLIYSTKIEQYLMEILRPITITLVETPAYRNDLNVFRQTISRLPQLVEALFSIIQNISVLAIYLYLISQYAWYYSASLILCAVPLIYHYIKYANDTDQYMRNLIQKSMEASNLSTLLTEPSNQKEMIIFSNRNFFIEKWRKAYSDIMTNTFNYYRKYLYRNSLIGTIFPLIYFFIQIHVVFRLIHGELTLGDLVAITSAIGVVETNIKTLNRPVSGFKNFSIFVANIKEFFSKYDDSINGKVQVSTIQTLELKNLDFSYPNYENEILSNINFFASKGSLISFVGDNGSGKSTLAKLLAGLHAVPRNSFFVNSTDMCELERSSFQKKVSIHNQDFSRFPLTIYENIKLDEIDELEKESIHRFLSENSFLIQEDLYDKLDVTLGNQYLYSKQISGGQWQRIALSRAFYKNSDLLIIDEGTAEIDPFTQREIFEYLGKIKREKIIIYVTHDLKLASLADKIFVFKNGMIIEEGPHHELIQKNGEYSKMWGDNDES